MIERSPAEEVIRVWNWLPAFRAVAETEHLPTAARQLYVTPSALSRTIGLLEKELGRALFRRVGRRIELNEAGGNLLARVRQSMRLAHQGLQEATDTTMVGPVRIYGSGIVAPLYIEPAIEEMRSQHPRLIAYLGTTLQEGLEQDLLRGRIDIAFRSPPLSSPHLVTQHLGSVSNGVYCAPGHPLFRKRKITLEHLRDHPFAAPAPDPSGANTDGWPDRYPRTVGLYADHMAVGIRACASGRLLAVLPDPIATQHKLKRLPMDELPAAPMYAIHRPFLAEEERAALFLGLVRDQIASVGRGRPRAGGSDTPVASDC